MPIDEHLQGMTVIIGYPDEERTDTLALAVAGDESAFARIVASHHASMTKVCYLVCGDLDLADEAVAAAWPKAWRSLGTVRDPERLDPWLVSVAANEARQLMRRNRRRSLREIPADETSAGTVSDPAARAAGMDLIDALARLSPDDRTLLALRYVAGFDSTELGRATGRSSSGTRARLARLLDGLRKELGDD